MAVNLGLIASSISGNLGGSDFEFIERITLSGSSNTITFSSIPSTYKHLEIRSMTRSAYASTAVGGSQYKIQFNGDTSTNYSFNQMNGNGSNFTASSAGSNYIWGIAPWASAGNFGGSLFVPMIMRIHNYSNTSKNKTVLMSEGFSANAASTNQYVAQRSGVWYSTSAINSITFDQTPGAYSDGAFASGTTIALYGVK